MRFARNVHWLCDSPSPYNAQLFRAITAESEIGLLVHYRRLKLSSHPWQSTLTEGHRFRVCQEVLGIDWTLVTQALRSPERLHSDAFVIGGWNHPTAWLMLTLLALRRANFGIWTDTPNPARERRGWQQWARATLLQWVFARAQYVMGTGEPALKILEKMGAPRSRLFNFPYWIDLELYRCREGARTQQRDGRSLVFFSAGRVQNNLKGHDIAIRALALAAERAERAFEYSIAGVGPDVETLRELAREQGIGDRVKLLGWLEPDKLIKQLKVAEVLIHPSPVHEPYGVAVIEAMAAGMVVLASNVTCAALDRIDSGRNGLIHHSGDVEELATQICDLLADRSEIARLGNAARKTAERWPLSRGVALVNSVLAGPHRA